MSLENLENLLITLKDQQSGTDDFNDNLLREATTILTNFQNSTLELPDATQRLLIIFIMRLF